MPIKFYTDAHIPTEVALQLRKKGVDVVRCQEMGMTEASDPEHLELATRENRTLVSFDEDFLALHSQWQSEGRKHTGIMRVQSHLQGEAGIGKIVTCLLDYHLMIEGGAGTLEDDIFNRVTFIK